jgi:hypothetical protein
MQRRGFFSPASLLQVGLAANKTAYPHPVGFLLCTYNSCGLLAIIGQAMSQGGAALPIGIGIGHWALALLGYGSNFVREREEGTAHAHCTPLPSIHKMRKAGLIHSIVF